jgi:putative ubiquitin-RnfH superfamily antitoxin RatB of RatAB toxin-antitoxin module
MNTVITVKVGTVPGTLTELALNSGATVAQALELANLSASGYDVRMDGETVAVDAVIPATAKVIVLVKQIKGNADTNIYVKVGTVPGTLTELALTAGSTVGQAIELAGLATAGYDIRMDGETVSADATIPATAKVIVLVKQIKGNN